MKSTSQTWNLNGVAVELMVTSTGVYARLQRRGTGTWSEPQEIAPDMDTAVYEQWGGNVRNWFVGSVLPALNTWLARVLPAGTDIAAPAVGDTQAEVMQLIASLQFRQTDDGITYAELP